MSVRDWIDRIRPEQPISSIPDDEANDPAVDLPLPDDPERVGSDEGIPPDDGDLLSILHGKEGHGRS